MTGEARTERGVRAGVRRLFRLPLRTPAAARADADAELDAFLEERIEHLVRRGMTPADARAEALRRLGAPVGEVRDALRHSAERQEGRKRLRDAVDELLDDVRFARRQFAKAPGFTAVATLTLALGNNSGRQPALRAAIVERLGALPGVTDVALGPMPGKGWAGGGLETDGDGRTTRVPTLGTNFVSPGYFRAARIAVVEGRLPDSSGLTAAWKAGPPSLSPEVVVSRGLAGRLWPGGGAIGSRVRMPPGFRADQRVEPWSTVVGVVDDVRLAGVRGDLRALQLYSLFPPRLPEAPVLVSAATPGEDAAPTIKRAVAAVDRAILVRRSLAGEAYLRDSLAPSRFAMALLTAFATIALVLSAVGLYGVIAYSVSQRTREIGVRVALGAAPGAVVGLVVGGGLRLAAAGVAIGAVIAAATTRVLESMLYAVSPVDPFTFAVIALLVAAIALVASYVPARRALRIDPAETLRAA